MNGVSLDSTRSSSALTRQIVDDVTFSLALNQITVSLCDASTITYPVSKDCAATLEQVVHQVNLSFQAPPSPLRPVAGPAGVNAIAKKSTSSLLLTLLSPLLASSPVSSPEAAPRPAPSVHTARMHRRQARSLLVDAYRQFVLPALKHHLPSAFLAWSMQSELTKKDSDFAVIKTEIDALLGVAGITLLDRPQMRPRSISSSSCSSSSGSDSDDGPITPATSRFTSPSISTISVDKTASASNQEISRKQSPASYLLSIPPHTALPAQMQTRYITLLSKLSKIASRTSSLNKLSARYEREESKRRWLESVDASRLAETATRRAAANGNVMARENLRMAAKPIKKSSLWQSWTANESTSNSDVEEAPVQSSSPPAYICELSTPRRPSLQAIAAALATSVIEAADDHLSTKPNNVVIPWDTYTLQANQQGYA